MSPPAKRGEPFTDFIRLFIDGMKNTHLYVVSALAFVLWSVLFKDLFSSVFLGAFIFIFSAGYISYEKWVNRKEHLLSQMPIMRKDPTFIIDHFGRIIISMGRTKKMFERKNIKRLDDIFGEKNAGHIVKHALTGDRRDIHSFEYFSEAFELWYRIQLTFSENKNHIFIWLVDVTDRKRLDLSLSAIRRFNQDVIHHIDDLIRENDVYHRLAKLIFQEGFKGVFIARFNPENNLAGYAFKASDKTIIRSEKIIIKGDSPVAALFSQKTGKPSYANKKKNWQQSQFEKKYPFDTAIKRFLAFSIVNFLNYHESDTVMICYNKASGVNHYDRFLIETLANSARTVTYLTDLAIRNARVISDLEVAHETQRQLLPGNDPVIPGFDVSGMSRYCDRTGGDYYDYIHPVRSNNRLWGLVIADVSGHGISAALMMTATRALLKCQSELFDNPSETLISLNHYLCQHTLETGNFVTMLYLIFDPERNTVYWSRAGHEPVLGYNPVEDDFFELKGKGIALGFDPLYRYDHYEFNTLIPGTVLLLATDGLWEAKNEVGQMLGKERVKKILRENATRSSEEIKTLLFSSVESFITGSLEDDLSIVVAKYNG